MSVCIDGVYVPDFNESAIGQVCPTVNTQYLIDQALEANVSTAQTHCVAALTPTIRFISIWRKALLIAHF